MKWGSEVLRFEWAILGPGGLFFFFFNGCAYRKEASSRVNVVDCEYRRMKLELEAAASELIRTI